MELRLFVSLLVLFVLACLGNAVPAAAADAGNVLAGLLGVWAHRARCVVATFVVGAACVCVCVCVCGFVCGLPAFTGMAASCGVLARWTAVCVSLLLHVWHLRARVWRACLNMCVRLFRCGDVRDRAMRIPRLVLATDVRDLRV